VSTIQVAADVNEFLTADDEDAQAQPARDEPMTLACSRSE
jgi:hypothetical protein